VLEFAADVTLRPNLKYLSRHQALHGLSGMLFTQTGAFAHQAGYRAFTAMVFGAAGSTTIRTRQLLARRAPV